MDCRYLRNFPALTEAEWQLLQKRRILIAGCGGIGGHLLDMLLRMGAGTIRICDGDVFEPSNLNRQLLSDVTAMGQSKVLTAAQYASRVNPDVRMEIIDSRMTQENVESLIADCDAVLDALDNIESRRILSRACDRAGIPYVFGAIGGWVGQAAISMPGQGLIDILYPEETAVAEKSVLSFTPAMCAAIQASLCVKLLTGRPVQTGRIYYFDLLNQEFETIPLECV